MLSTEEIASASASLAKLDRDQSGDLQIIELGGPGPFRGTLRFQPLIRVLDLNGDITIAAHELENASAALLKLDRDGDQQVSKQELNFEKPVDPGFQAIPSPMRSVMSEYFSGIEGKILPDSSSNAADGYLLIHETSNHNDVQMGRHTYLVDKRGVVVHNWHNKRYSPETSSAKLLANGLLLRTVGNNDWIYREQYPLGAHGVLELVDWDGETLWQYKLDMPGRNVLHHDFELIPNGNILVTAYVGFTVEEAAEIGFDPQLANGDIVWFESLIELVIDIEKQSAKIAWQWNSWDHIIQDEFPDKPNYGKISENPGRIDVNATALKTLPFNSGEVHHINSISYNEALDQILISSAATGEVWVVDHSTTRAEAATGKGGRANQGGRLLYRWGNPAMIGDADTPRSLFWQQDAKWLKTAKDESPKILLFNSGLRRTADGKYDENQEYLGIYEGYSDILEMALPLTESGNYMLSSAPETVWNWNADNTESFYALFAGGVSRLDNGHTLLVQSHTKRIIEITPEGERLLDFNFFGPGNIFTIEKLSPDYSGVALLGSK